MYIKSATDGAKEVLNCKLARVWNLAWRGMCATTEKGGCSIVISRPRGDFLRWLGFSRYFLLVLWGLPI